MSDFVTTFVAIASALFVTELTDKDALLILALATKTRAVTVFLAGSTAFVLTTIVNVTAGSVAASFVPILWIKVAGGTVMVAYGLWEANGLVGQKLVEEEEKKLEKKRDGKGEFLWMVGALALLDLAGDATQVLTIVFVAQYSAILLVFAATCVGLIAATATQTVLGKGLGKMFTPQRLRYVSIVVFLVLGAFIIISSLI